jgi:choline-sulfatase
MAIAVSPYDAEIAGVDRQIGRIVDTLRKTGQIDNTLLILMADCGESLGEHGEQMHAIFVYDATVHISLMIRYQPAFTPSVYSAPVRSVDVVPTAPWPNATPFLSPSSTETRISRRYGRFRVTPR